MQQIDVRKVLEGKSPALARRVPKFAVDYLRRTIHEGEINAILSKFADSHGIEFVRGALGEMGIGYRSVGMDELRADGRYVFASNHPFGGLDGLMLADEVARKFGDVKVIVNDILMYINPIKELFLPVNHHGRQNAEGAKAVADAFESNIPIITFPAGMCSRRRGGVVCDLEWKPNFVRKAAAADREIVPVYFGGELSGFFYRLSNFRRALGVKANVEMLYLPDEMFKQAGSDFEIIIGNPVCARELTQGRTPHEAAQYVKDLVYALKNND